MRTTFYALATAALFTGLAFSNGDGKTYYFTHPVLDCRTDGDVHQRRTMLE